MSETIDSGVIDVEPDRVHMVYAIVTNTDTVVETKDLAPVYMSVNPTYSVQAPFRMLVTRRDFPAVLSDPDDLGEIIGHVDKDDPELGNTLMLVQVLGIKTRTSAGDPTEAGIVFVTCYGAMAEGAVMFLKYPMAIRYSPGSSKRKQRGETGQVIAEANRGAKARRPPGFPSAEAGRSGSARGWVFGALAVVVAALLAFFLFRSPPPSDPTPVATEAPAPAATDPGVADAPDVPAPTSAETVQE